MFPDWQGIAVFFVAGLIDFTAIYIISSMTKDFLVKAIVFNNVNATLSSFQQYVEIGDRNYILYSLLGIYVFGSLAIYVSMRKQRWFDEQFKKLQKRYRQWVARSVVHGPQRVPHPRKKPDVPAG